MPRGYGGRVTALPPPPAPVGDFAEFRFAPERAWEDAPDVADGAVRRVVVVGDVHSEGLWVRGAVHIAAFEECDAVVQVGDFWLQDGSSTLWPPRRMNLSGEAVPWPDAMRRAMSSPVPFIVLDGNHEVWPCLDRYLERPEVAELRLAGRPVHLGGSLWWADRGSTWTWAGRRCGALGGAVSPDKYFANPAYRWPDSEAPTWADQRRLVANAPDGLDVLFTHDAPGGVAGLGDGMAVPAWIAAECADVKDLLQAAVAATRPRLLFHGHWHRRNHEHIRPADTEVYGLNQEGRSGWAAVLDLDEMHAHWIEP